MNSSNLVRILLLSMLASWPILMLAQEPEEGQKARGAFITGRSKTSGAKTGPSAKPQPPADKLKAIADPQSEKTNSAAVDKTGAEAGLSEDPIGVGYTLYKEAPNGKAARVSSAQVFYKGDAIRLVLEPHADGYLYVFHTENDGEPEMIFPDHRLNQGENRIQAHVPYEVPSSKGPFPWFEFTEQAATERLYLVVTRKPLPKVPTGGELVAHCRATTAACPWRPTSAVWGQIVASASAPRLVSTSRVAGQSQTTDEREAIARGIKLRPKAPDPSVVEMNVSPGAGMLVTKVELIHK